MKYRFKLAIFVMLGLLAASCNKSAKSGKALPLVYTTAIRGVLEKGKATEASCNVYKLNGTLYSKSNHIDKGGYVAAIPNEPFLVSCNIKEYVNDITGIKEKAPYPITLQAISSPIRDVVGKDQALNVNLLSDLMVQTIQKEQPLDSIQDSMSLDMAKQKAQVQLGDYIPVDAEDTLSLQNRSNLAKFSLAVQKQIDHTGNGIASIKDACNAAMSTSQNTIESQDAYEINPKAIATPLPTSVKPSKPIGKEKIDKWLYVSKMGIARINAYKNKCTQATTDCPNLATSFPRSSLPLSQTSAELAIIITQEAGNSNNNDIYLKGDNIVKLDTVSHQVKLKDLFSTKTLSAIDNDSTTISFCKVAKDSPAPTAASCDDLTVGRLTLSADTANIKLSITKAIVSLENVLLGRNSIKTKDGVQLNKNMEVDVAYTNQIDLKLPIESVIGLDPDNTEKVWITGEFGLNPPKAIELNKKYGFYQNIDIKSLFGRNQQETTFKICILPSTSTAKTATCSDVEGTQTFTAHTDDDFYNSIDAFTANDGTKLDGKPLFPLQTAVETSSAVPFSIPANLLTMGSNETVYIVSNKPNVNLIELHLVRTVADTDYVYRSEDISNLFFTNSNPTEFTVCILPRNPTPTVSLCKNDVEKQNFTATAVEIQVPSTEQPTFTLAGATIASKKVAMNPIGINTSGDVKFSISEDKVTLDSGNSVYITSNKEEAIPILLEDREGAYFASVQSLFKSTETTHFTVCILPTIATLAKEDTIKCNAITDTELKQTFTATATGISALTVMQEAGATINNKPIVGNTISIPFAMNKDITFSLPASTVTLASGDSVYFATDFSQANNDIVVLSKDKTKYVAYRIQYIMRASGNTLLAVCILPITPKPTATACLNAKIKQTFTVSR